MIADSLRRAGSARRRRAGTARRRRPLRQAVARWVVSRNGRRVCLALLIVLALLGGIWLWLRDSSLVAVKRVTVTGASGPDAGQIRDVLVTAARNMTTLDVNQHQLDVAVAPYPVVKSLSVTTQFPHGMRINVTEESPVASIDIGGRSVPVAGDGTLLKDGAASGPLPTVPLSYPPGGTRLSDPAALTVVRLLAAAPYQLLSRISQATTSSTHGVVAQIRNGPAIYFGDGGRLAAKWQAAAGVLADSRSAGAQYIDVTDPIRPVAGASAPSGNATASGAAGTPSTSAAAVGTTATTPATGAGTTATTPATGAGTSATSGG